MFRFVFYHLFLNRFVFWQGSHIWPFSWVRAKTSEDIIDQHILFSTSDRTLYIKNSMIFNFEIINYSWFLSSFQTFSSVVDVLWIIIIYNMELFSNSLSLSFIAMSGPIYGDNNIMKELVLTTKCSIECVFICVSDKPG